MAKKGSSRQSKRSKREAFHSRFKLDDIRRRVGEYRWPTKVEQVMSKLSLLGYGFDKGLCYAPRERLLALLIVSEASFSKLLGITVRQVRGLLEQRIKGKCPHFNQHLHPGMVIPLTTRRFTFTHNPLELVSYYGKNDERFEHGLKLVRRYDHLAARNSSGKHDNRLKDLKGEISTVLGDGDLPSNFGNDISLREFRRIEAEMHSEADRQIEVDLFGDVDNEDDLYDDIGDVKWVDFLEELTEDEV